MRGRRGIVAWLATSLCVHAVFAATPEVTAQRAIVVASSGPGTAQAGLDLLRRGGTAMDAAMAVAMAQPCYALGSFVSYAGIITLMYYDAATRRVFSLDGGYNSVLGEKDPASIPGPRGELVAASRGGPASEPSGRTALVPGFFAGAAAAHERFGKLPFADVVAPGVRCAEEGFVLTPYHVGLMRARTEVLSRLPETKAVFTKPDGSAYEVGDTFKQPALAKTLRSVAREGVRPYIYEGPWAKTFVEAVHRDGGFMTMADLAAYEATWVEPTHGKFNEFDVYSLGTPVLTGLGMVKAMQLAERAALADAPSYERDPRALFDLLQISKLGTMLGTSNGTTQLGQLLGLELSPQSLQSPQTSDALWGALVAGRVPLVKPIAAPEHTDAIVVVDEQGNVAAVVHSINTVNWGSTGIFVDGVSIPDSASFQQGTLASLAPGSRVPATTHPGLALKNGNVALAFGSTGSGSMTRSIAALLAVLGHRMTPQEAIDAPALGGFEFAPGPPAEIVAIVGEGEFGEAYLRSLQELGQPTRASNAGRGYWLGVGIDAETGLRRAGVLREFPQLGGGAVGY